MKYRLLFSISRTHLWSRKKQSLIAALGVTFGIGAYIIMMSFMTGLNGLSEGSLLDKDLLPVIFPHIGPDGYQTSMLNPWGNHTHNEMAQSTAKTYHLVELILYTLELEGLSVREKTNSVLDRKKNTTDKKDKLDTKLESPSDNHGVPAF